MTGIPILIKIAKGWWYPHRALLKKQRLFFMQIITQEEENV